MNLNQLPELSNVSDIRECKNPDFKMKSYDASFGCQTKFLQLDYQIIFQTPPFNGDKIHLTLQMSSKTNKRSEH